MKFVHAADLHLESTLSKVSSFYGQTPLSISKQTHLAFIKMIDLAISEKVDFILLAGDIFDADWKDYAVGLLFIEQIKRLNCPVFYIRGNHDAENRLLKKLPFPKNLKLFGSKEPQTFFLDHLRVAIHGQSYEKYHTQKDLSSKYPKAVSGYYNIGLLHTSGEKTKESDFYAPFNKSCLLEKKYDYWALGHTHASKVLSHDPMIVYSGMLQGRQIKEKGAKGIYLVEVDNQKISRQKFIECSNTIWEEVILESADIKSEWQIKEILVEAVEKVVGKYFKTNNFILRFTVRGKWELKENISGHQSYWQHCFFCWLDHFDNVNIYIEKIIDKTISQHEELSNPLYTLLMKKLEQREMKKSLKDLINEETSELIKQLPVEITKFIKGEVNNYCDDEIRLNLINYFENALREFDENTQN